jgi:hypothetical protein
MCWNDRVLQQRWQACSALQPLPATAAASASTAWPCMTQEGAVGGSGRDKAADAAWIEERRGEGQEEGLGHRKEKGGVKKAGCICESGLCSTSRRLCDLASVPYTTAGITQ